MIDRREFVKICAALTPIGSCITNLLSVTGQSDKPADVVIMTLNCAISSEQAVAIEGVFAEAGVRCIIIADGDFLSSLHVVNRSDKTFHGYGWTHCPARTQEAVYGDGKLIEDPLWCDTRLGLVCHFSPDGRSQSGGFHELREIVSMFDKVEVKSSKWDIGEHVFSAMPRKDNGFVQSEYEKFAKEFYQQKQPADADASSGLGF